MVKTGATFYQQESHSNELECGIFFETAESSELFNEDDKRSNNFLFSFQQSKLSYIGIQWPLGLYTSAKRRE